MVWVAGVLLSVFAVLAGVLIVLLRHYFTQNEPNLIDKPLPRATYYYRYFDSPGSEPSSPPPPFLPPQRSASPPLPQPSPLPSLVRGPPALPPLIRRPRHDPRTESGGFSYRLPHDIEMKDTFYLSLGSRDEADDALRDGISSEPRARAGDSRQPRDRPRSARGDGGRRDRPRGADGNRRGNRRSGARSPAGDEGRRRQERQGKEPGNRGEDGKPRGASAWDALD
jgi:hypothetical protein